MGVWVPLVWSKESRKAVGDGERGEVKLWVGVCNGPRQVDQD